MVGFSDASGTHPLGASVVFAADKVLCWRQVLVPGGDIKVAMLLTFVQGPVPYHAHSWGLTCLGGGWRLLKMAETTVKGS